MGTMSLQKLPPLVLESAQQKLKAFRARLSRVEWKAFNIVNADEELLKKLISAHKIEDRLLTSLDAKTRLPCVVCQGHQGIIYCSMTFTSKLNQKEKLSHTRFKPSVYYVISEALIDLFGGTRLDKLPLIGKDFCSLRQLYYNKVYEGRLFRRAVKDTHSVDYVQVHEHVSSDSKSEMIIDEDMPWKIRKGKYYRKHFCPERDPVITKFAVSNSSRFRGSRATRQLNCDLKVTFRTENLLKFIDYSMDKAILDYPLKPFLRKVLSHGSTSISLDSSQ